LAMLRLKDLQWSYNYRCDANLHAFFYIEVIKVTPLIATTIWLNSKETYLYIHRNHSSHLFES
jgi:hypothetical protein